MGGARKRLQYSDRLPAVKQRHHDHRSSAKPLGGERARGITGATLLESAWAAAHSVLVIAYHMLRNGVDFNDPGDDYFDRMNTAKRKHFTCSVSRNSAATSVHMAAPPSDHARL